jgi:hypothetical protein
VAASVEVVGEKTDLPASLNLHFLEAILRTDLVVAGALVVRHQKDQKADSDVLTVQLRTHPLTGVEPLVVRKRRQIRVGQQTDLAFVNVSAETPQKYRFPGQEASVGWHQTYLAAQIYHPL